MLKKQKKISKILFSLFAIAFIFIILPGALIKPNESAELAVVITLGIDKTEENGYTSSVQILAPEAAASNKQKTAVASASGNNFMDSLSNLAIKLGKKIGFEHCGTIVIGSGMQNENIVSNLNSFYRTSKISLNASVVECEGKAEDILIQANELGSQASFDLNKAIMFTKKYFSSGETSNLGMLFNAYYSKSSISNLTYINKNKESSNASQSGGAQDSGNTSGATSKLSLINNDRATAIYKNGVKQFNLTPQQTREYNWTNNYAKEGFITLYNLNEKPFENANLTLKIQNKSTSQKYKIKNNKFVVDYKIKIKCEAVEIKQNNKSQDINNSFNEYVTNEVKQKLSNLITQEVNEFFNFCKQTGCDMLNLETDFYKYKNKQYKHINKTGKEFLENCEINVKIEVDPFN